MHTTADTPANAGFIFAKAAYVNAPDQCAEDRPPSGARGPQQLRRYRPVIKVTEQKPDDDRAVSLLLVNRALLNYICS